MEDAQLDTPRPEGETITFNFGNKGRIYVWPRKEGMFSEERILQRIHALADRPQGTLFMRRYLQWKRTDDEPSRKFLYRAAEGSLRAEQHAKNPRFGTMVFDEGTIQPTNALSRQEADLDADELDRILRHARDKGVRAPWTG